LQRKGNHLPKSIAEFKTAWRYISVARTSAWCEG